MESYGLAAELSKHVDDVRAVASGFYGMFGCASRDGTATIWQVKGSSHELCGILPVCVSNSGGVSCIHFIPPSIPNFPQGAIVTGDYEKNICIWSLELVLNSILESHTSAVLCITHSKDGKIITGSSDNSIIVWYENCLLYRLLGHKSPVWDVECLDNGFILSASGDGTIKIWSDQKLVSTLTGHVGSVRTLISLTSDVFASSGNDGTIKIWHINGNLISTWNAHSEAIFSITKNSSNQIVSSGDDGMIKIWQDGNLIEKAYAPSGIWSVSVMENDDLIAGCQDGVIRIWSRNPEKKISNEFLMEYEKRVRAHQEGLKRISEGRKIGGKSYDYVIDVDVNPSMPPLKLGYNVGEDPKDAALKFLYENRLPIGYLDEVIDFILKNTNQSRTDVVGGNNRVFESIHFPQSQEIIFAEGNIPRIKKKILEFNLVDRNLDAILGMENAKDVSDLCVKELEGILDDFGRDDEKSFPFLDLARLWVLREDFAKRITSLDIYIKFLFSKSENSRIMAWRFLANVTKYERFNKQLLNFIRNLNELLLDVQKSDKKSLRVAAFCFFINMSLLVSENENGARELLACAKNMVKVSNSALDPIYNSFVVIGTLATYGFVQMDDDLKGLLKMWSNSMDENIRAIVEDLNRTLMYK